VQIGFALQEEEIQPPNPVHQIHTNRIKFKNEARLKLIQLITGKKTNNA
jgi:hypothetical protein